MTTNRNAKLFMAVALISALTIPGFALGTGKLTITGTMPLVETITVTSLNPTLDMQNGVSGLALATIVEKCNGKSGYIVSISSDNAGKLAQSGSTDAVTYKLSYAGGALFTPTVADYDVATVDKKTSKTGDTKTLAITFDAPTEFLDDGDYTDTLTFTITAQ